MITQNSPVRIKATENRVEAVKLRKSGLTFEQIGSKLGISTQRAHKIVSEELQKAQAELKLEGSDLLHLELDRLDELQANHWEAATQGGNVKAALLVLKIMERRAKLLGLDKPIRTQVESRLGNMTDEELEEEARRLGIVLTKPNPQIGFTEEVN